MIKKNTKTPRSTIESKREIKKKKNSNSYTFLPFEVYDLLIMYVVTLFWNWSKH